MDADTLRLAGRSPLSQPAHMNLNGYMRWLAVFSVAANLLLLAMPLYLSQIYDRVLPSDSPDTLLYLSLFILMCLALFGMMEVLRNKVAQKMSACFELRLAPRLLHHALRTRASNKGDYALLLQDVANIRQMLASRAFIGLFDLPFTPLFLCLLFLVHPVLGVLATLGAGLLVLLALANEMLASDKQGKATDQHKQGTAKSNEILTHLDDVCAMGMGEALRGRWQDTMLQAAHSADDVAQVNGAFFGLVRFFRQMIQVAMLGFGAYLVLTSHLSAGLIFAASIVSGRALMPIEQFIGAWRGLASSRAAHRRVRAQLDRMEDAERDAAPRLELPQIEGRLWCQGVTVIPEGEQFDKAILKNINLEIEPGHVVAIIGASGAGKTALLRVLATVSRPDLGRYFIDGFETTQWDADQLGANIGYSAQESHFFRGTVAQNIARFSPTADARAVIAAANMAGAHDFIGTLPQGYNTLLGSEEIRLSGGQKQRIALARAFFGDPQILLLDEPDSHLDFTGEQALRNAIKDAKTRGKTVIFATQRNLLVTSADKVLVMEAGRIANFGERQELLPIRAQSADKPQQLNAPDEPLDPSDVPDISDASNPSPSMKRSS
ncbi:type I secretion system permease/ATPase [Cohaesibacter sp. CAU 1516]|nr:type I secretion system permease/ATPase [Cohaesibacter sp. CAU 1516]